MSENFIVLQSWNPVDFPAAPLPIPHNVGLFPVDGAPGSFYSLTVAELSKAERTSVANDPRTLAIARPMPLKLIEPTESEPVTEPQVEGSTWGVQAVGAVDSPFTGDGIVVAVLDTGIDPAHPAFAGVELVRRNFTGESDDDIHGHGTHCAGTIFGRDVDNLRIGVAPGVKRALIGKVVGQEGGSSDALAKAMIWAVQNGAHVISMSLGIDFTTYVQVMVGQGMDIRAATSNALAEYRNNVDLFTRFAAVVENYRSYGRGATIVAASGNESRRPDFEVVVTPPAASEGIVAVGAVGQGDSGLEVAWFSNTNVDVCGPGVGVVSASLGGGLRSMTGTSMATPHVAGVAALWAEKLQKQYGYIESSSLSAQLIGHAVTAPLVDGAEEVDVGSGIVQAPSE